MSLPTASAPKSTIEAARAARELISSQTLTNGDGIDDGGVAHGTPGDNGEHTAERGANLQDARRVNMSSNVSGDDPPLPK